MYTRRHEDLNDEDYGKSNLKFERRSLDVGILFNYQVKQDPSSHVNDDGEAQDWVA